MSRSAPEQPARTPAAARSTRPSPVPAPGSAPGPARTAGPAARPRRPGPHSRLSLAVLGASLLATAAICLMVLNGAIGLVNGGLLLIGAPVLILGAGIALSGLGRRRGGWISLLGWPALLTSLPVLTVGAMVPASVRDIPGDQVAQAVGTTTYTWQDMVDSGSGSGRALPAVAGGEVILDLRDMPQGAQAAEELSGVDLEVGAGVVRVIVPQDRPILIDARSSAGWLSARVPQDWRLTGGTRQPGTGRADDDAVVFAAEQEYMVDGSPSQVPVRSAGTLLRPAQLRSSAEGAPLTIRVRMGIGEISVSSPESVTWAGDASQEVWIVEYWRDETGELHVDETHLAVPGMSHPAISARRAEECLDQALIESGAETDDPGEDADWEDAGRLSAQERESYDACVQQVLEDQASAAESAGAGGPGGPAPSASPTTQAPASPTAPHEPSAEASPTTTP